MARRIAFTGKQQVQLDTFELPALGEDQIQLRTLYSLMSTGTENIVFNRLFDPGTHWDKWVKYPFYPGYLNVGEVEKVGAKVTDWKVGQRVVTRSGHASHHVLTPTNAWLLPSAIDPKLATWFGLAKIAAMGARVAEYRLGDSVAVIGAGPIGQMTVRWAAAAGVETLIVIDTVPERLEHATRGGASHVICKPVTEALEDAKAANHGELPRVVVDSTGHPAVFGPALGLAAKFGRFVL
ncbi:MAG: zinc-binding dehydrogenase, partial [Phycisphaerae bacterium]